MFKLMGVFISNAHAHTIYPGYAYKYNNVSNEYIIEFGHNYDCFLVSRSVYLQRIIVVVLFNY